MGKITITDDCLTPSRHIYLDYSGHDPFGVSKKIVELLQPFFGVSSAGISETDFRWDNTGDPITFYFTWWVQRNYGKSLLRIDIKVQGSKGKTKNVGNFTMELKGEIVTSFGYSTSLTKSLWWIYNYVFYGRRRRNYIDMCRNQLEKFRIEIAEHYNLRVREG